MIEGTLVDLVEPFPSDRLKDFHRWLATFPLIARADGFPEELMEFEMTLRAMLPKVRSWGCWTKEGELGGAILLEPVGTMGLRAYIASDRKVWGTGLMDEAAETVMRIAFLDRKAVTFLFAAVAEQNAPSKAFTERIGMRLKNTFPEQNLRLYEITREQWWNQLATQRAAA